MGQPNRFSIRFAELLDQLAAVEQTKRRSEGDFPSGFEVDSNALLNWKVKAKSLIGAACGEASGHYRAFVDAENPGFYSTNYTALGSMKAVFRAAQEDFDGGYLSSIRSLVAAELPSSELDQARSLLDSGYKVAAAVTCGIVLEENLRQRCLSRGLEPSKLDRMNADLGKVSEYNLLVQKRITALADIRNSAAHGRVDAFVDDDVADMITQVERFITQMD